MKEKLLLFLVIISILFSCKENVASDDCVVLLPETIKKGAISLKSEVIEFKESNIHASEYFVYNDSVFILCNYSTNEEALNVYSYPSLKRIADFIPFGKGPGEISSAKYFIRNESIMVFDPNVRVNSILHIDSLLNENYKPIFNNHGIYIAAYDEYSKDSLVVANPYCFEDDESGIMNEADRLVIINKNNKLNELEVYGKHEYLTQSVTLGSVLSNKTKNCIIFADHNNTKLEFYDYDLNLKKHIKILDELDIKYDISSYDRMVLGTSVYGITNTYKEDEFFYVSYVGSKCDRLKPRSDYDTWILKFDWDGNLIKSYHYDKLIIAFTVSNVKDTFYATTYDSDDLYILVKLTKK